MHRVVTLVAWLVLVSEANCIKEPEGQFPCCFLLFSLFLLNKETTTKTGCLIQLVSTTTVNHATMVANHSAVKLISQWQQLPMLLHSFVLLTVLPMKHMKFLSSLSRCQGREMTPRKMRKRTIPMSHYLLTHPGNRKIITYEYICIQSTSKRL